MFLSDGITKLSKGHLAPVSPISSTIKLTIQSLDFKINKRTEHLSPKREKTIIKFLSYEISEGSL